MISIQTHSSVTMYFSLSICVYVRCKIHRRRSCDTEIAHTRCRLLTFFLLTISLFIYRFSLIASLSSHPWCVLLLFKFNFQLNSIQTHWNRVPYLHSMATLLSNLVLKCFSKLQIAIHHYYTICQHFNWTNEIVVETKPWEQRETVGSNESGRFP